MINNLLYLNHCQFEIFVTYNQGPRHGKDMCPFVFVFQISSFFNAIALKGEKSNKVPTSTSLSCHILLISHGLPYLPLEEFLRQD